MVVIGDDLTVSVDDRGRCDEQVGMWNRTPPVFEELGHPSCEAGGLRVERQEAKTSTNTVESPGLRSRVAGLWNPPEDLEKKVRSDAEVPPDHRGSTKGEPLSMKQVDYGLGVDGRRLERPLRVFGRGPWLSS